MYVLRLTDNTTSSSFKFQKINKINLEIELFREGFTIC